MSIAILILAILAIGHFVYDGIVLPSVRMRIRVRLFALRDKLRLIKFYEDPELDERVFDHLQGAINYYVNNLHLLTISTAIRINGQLEHDEELRRRVKQRSDMMLNCANEEVRNIHLEFRAKLKDAMIANSGAWVFYLLPIAIAIGCYQKIKEIANEALLMPKGYMEKMERIPA